MKITALNLLFILVPLSVWAADAERTEEIGAPGEDPVIEKAIDDAQKAEEPAPAKGKIKPASQSTTQISKPVAPSIPKSSPKMNNKKEEVELLAWAKKNGFLMNDKIEKPQEEKNAVYHPAPAEAQEDKHEGYIVERDSQKIIKKRLAVSDSMILKVCFSAGLSVIMDSDIQTEIQRVIIDDDLFFGVETMDNRKGVYIHLKSPIPDGKHWESAVRLVRKDNDQTYLINLLGVSCPKGRPNPFPKIVYLKDKNPAITGKTTKMMTPEDTIIKLSEGLPRENVNKIKIPDLLARSGSDWAVLSLEIQPPSDRPIELPEKNLQVKILDNLQVDEIPTVTEILPIHTEKATAFYKQQTLRLKVVVNIDRQYFVEKRYLYLMLLNKKDKYYQYIKVDTRGFISKLRERGFDI